MQPTCPLCQSTYVRRAHRAGFLEQTLSLFYIYPFRCQLCSARFTTLQWGVRYSAQTEDPRRYERISVHFPVLFGNALTVGKGVVTDMSVADCAISTDLPLQQGDTLKLELYPKTGRPPIVVAQAVVRSIRQGLAGVQFVDVEESEKARLNRFVSGMVGVPVTANLPPESHAPDAPLKETIR